MKKVLVISYFYPPLGGVGVIRTLKFTKYLPEFGWMPYVLTVKNRDRFYTDFGRDEIPDHVRVYRAWNILNNLSVVEGGLRRIGVHSKVLIPDAYLGWIPMAVKKGKEIIEQENIDLIYVSGPPFSSALIGKRLKELTGVPLIIDFRDGWTINPYGSSYSLKVVERFDQKFERTVLSSTDHVIFNTDELRDHYVRASPSLILKSSVINNGFDIQDIPADPEPFDKYTIAYTGYFYGSRNPEAFLLALHQIIQEGMIPKDRIQFLWAGRDVPSIHQIVDHLGLSEIVRYLGLIPKVDADNLLYRSHLLLLIEGKTKDSTPTYAIPNKLFPYIASARPILALVSEGSSLTFLKKYADHAHVIQTGEISDIINVIVDEYHNYQSASGKQIVVSDRIKEFRKKYNYESLTASLSHIFEQITQ
ncbi:glycosyltransferase [Methanofollis sp. UBA420]|jgi:glycosyltransferase involved in cell wall biosynthesis|uniref:glycosyltransferase n=1 Tax=Methanofollis sp. UBA420 TaxID=1915514 RepID=UPI00316ABC62